MKFIPVFHQIGEVQSGPPASFIILKKSGPSIGVIHKQRRLNGGEGGFFSERADAFVISSNRQT